ncbi:MAG: hypothetical protein N2V76_08625 [Methanophagales archaeon]|nr:hypothetical protein [Methanophagales archaeon]
MLNVLADAVKDNFERKDLILISEIDENAFRGMDLKLVEKALRIAAKRYLKFENPPSGERKIAGLWHPKNIYI